MKLIEQAIEKIEKSILETLEDRLSISTEIVQDKAGDLSLITTSEWDGKVVMQHESDLEPLIAAIQERIK